MLNVIGYGYDYLRVKTASELDVKFVRERLPYLDLDERYYHGFRFVKLSGGSLEVVRIFEDVERVILELSYTLPVTRLDVFVDVEGDIVEDVISPGTAIMNGGRVETRYSENLSDRGNRAVFCRAYDAMTAGHYDVPVTRFECEFKRNAVRAILGYGEWKKNAVGCALRAFALLLGINIEIPNIEHTEFRGVSKKYSHTRERFYTRYGRGILNDAENMGFASDRKSVV